MRSRRTPVHGFLTTSSRTGARNCSQTAHGRALTLHACTQHARAGTHSHTRTHARTHALTHIHAHAHTGNRTIRGKGSHNAHACTNGHTTDNSKCHSAAVQHQPQALPCNQVARSPPLPKPIRLRGRFRALHCCPTRRPAGVHYLSPRQNRRGSKTPTFCRQMSSVQQRVDMRRKPRMHGRVDLAAAKVLDYQKSELRVRCPS